MANRRRCSLGAALALAAVVAVGDLAPARGHEPRTGGGVQFVVGWGEEPAYTGHRNSVQVILSEAGSGAPITALGDSLKVEVIKGSERVTLPLEPVSRMPGEYRAWVTPTRPGSYTFRLNGSVRGQPVDESFTSSGSTFDEVQDAADIQFPAKDPSTGQLASRIDRELPRLHTVAEDLEGRLDRTRTLAVVAVAAGILALVAAAVALALLRRRALTGGSNEGQKATREAERARSLSR